jgi:hypothetical protein
MYRLPKILKNLYGRIWHNFIPKLLAEYGLCLNVISKIFLLNLPESVC